MTFEYLWNGTWTKIGDSRTQQGYKVSAATHTAPATIPGQGGSYNVTLTGVLSSGVAVRAQSGGTALVSGTVPRSGTAVSLTIPGNLSYTNRTVTFEYQWNGTWTKIGADCSQPGWHVTKASVSPTGDIPAEGGTYTVTLEGWGGYQIRAMSGSTQLAINQDLREVANYSATLTIPKQDVDAVRNVTFQYLFFGSWRDIETRSQARPLWVNVTNYDCQQRCNSLGGIPDYITAKNFDWSMLTENQMFWIRPTMVNQYSYYYPLTGGKGLNTTAPSSMKANCRCVSN